MALSFKTLSGDYSMNAFHRSRFTWVTYILFAFYGYFLNILGPITPFLRNELHLSYTISSLHFTAFAVGMLVTGLTGDFLIRRIGRIRSLWIGAAGMSLGVVFLVIGRHPVMTISATFMMGCVGSLILVIVPAALSDEHHEKSAVAISEANLLTSLITIAAPLLVGWFAYTLFGWRLALLIGVFILLILFVFLGRSASPVAAVSDLNHIGSRLPFLFWVYWIALVMAVSVEFCMVFWSADFMENVIGMSKANAAQTVSLFMVGMVGGRFACSRLAHTISSRKMVLGSIFLTGAGFLLYWTAAIPWIGMTGLAITGLGVASLYPLIISLAITASGENTVQASTRASLASGTAILALPLVLGRLADLVGLKQAYLVIAVLLVAVLAVILVASRIEEHISPYSPGNSLER
jgi:MFS family permease